MHLRGMRDSLRSLVAAARIKGEEDQVASMNHAIELHASNLARAADGLLELIHELRVRGARSDLSAIDAEITEEAREAGMA